MLLPSAAFLLLGALQPAFGQAAGQCSANKAVIRRITPDQVIIGFNAENMGCDIGVRSWVGVWGADAPLKTDLKAWRYLLNTKGEVKFTKSELGSGELKAAFVCEDGWRIPFLVSGNFELGDADPIAKPGECSFKGLGTEKRFILPCENLEVSRICNDCQMHPGGCDACEECQKQCRQ